MQASMRILLAALLASVLGAPAGSASIDSVRAAQITSCDPIQRVHTFGLDMNSEVSWNGKQAANGGYVVAQDLCQRVDPATGLSGDGDPETGVGGGAFPSYQPCLPPGSIAHHMHVPGSIYWATNALVSAAYIVGTDGQDPTLPLSCLSDGVIGNDPGVEPYDCDSGTTGIAGTPMTANIVPNDLAKGVDCDPADGMTWVFFAYGAVFVGGQPVDTTATPPSLNPDQPQLQYVSVPIDGAISDVPWM